MCIIIDTNTLASVFKSDSQNHEEYKPVFDWIYSGNGTIVYGGSKYISEIGKFAGVFLEFRKSNKAIRIENQLVDDQEDRVSKEIEDPDFDDQHLVALLIISGCKLICSYDKRAHPFFKHKKFFPSDEKRPRIYSNKNNKDLLTRRYIADICKPCSSLTKDQKKLLGKVLKI